MPDIQQANSHPDEPAKADKYSLKTAIAFYESMPIGLRRITNFAITASGILIAVTALHPYLAKAIFLTGSLLDLFIVVAVIVQAYIYMG